MSSTADPSPLDGCSDLPSLLDEPEDVGLLRMTNLVEHLFHVPMAYVALLGVKTTVATRIGSGSAYWEYLKTYPLASSIAGPQLWPDPSGARPDGFISGDLKFAAAAPLRSSDGLDLGLLVIADLRARPDFSRKNLENLAELANVLAGKMELRMMASQARESELSLKEAESRFRNIANSAPVMLIYSGADGSTSFVNKAWLEFTGRSLEEEVGDGFEEMFHPDYRGAVMKEYWDAFQEHRPLTVEFPMRRRDGEYRWMQARGVPRFLDDGRLAGYIGCFIDMTDQRSALPNLQQAGAVKDSCEL